MKRNEKAKLIFSIFLFLMILLAFTPIYLINIGRQNVWHYIIFICLIIVYFSLIIYKGFTIRREKISPPVTSKHGQLIFIIGFLFLILMLFFLIFYNLQVHKLFYLEYAKNIFIKFIFIVLGIIDSLVFMIIGLFFALRK